MVYRSRVLVALILLATLLSYRAAWSADFVYEDNNKFPDTVHSEWSGLRLELQRLPIVSTHHFPTIRFVTGASFRLNAWLWPSARGFHLVNVGLHLVNVGLLMFLLWPLLAEWSIVAGGWFGLTVMGSEAVMGIAYRGELLATLFVLLAFIAAWRWRSAAWATAFGLLAFWSKETAACVLVLAWLPLAPNGRRIGPWAVWTAAAAAACVFFVRSAGMLHGWEWARQVSLNLLAMWVLVGRVMVPWHSTIDLDVAHASARVILGPCVALLGAFLMLAALSTGRKMLWLTAGVGFVLACLAFRVVSPSTELLHDHATYLANAGWAVGLTAAWAGIPYPERYGLHG